MIKDFARYTDFIFFSNNNYALGNRLRACLENLDSHLIFSNDIFELGEYVKSLRHTVIFVDKHYFTHLKLIAFTYSLDSSIIKSTRIVFIDDDYLKYRGYTNNETLFCIPERNLEHSVINIITKCEILEISQDPVININGENVGQIITQMLYEMGFSCKNIGFKYIKTCLEHGVRNNFILGNLSSNIYEGIAREYCTTKDCIDRNITTAVKNAYKEQKFTMPNISSPDKISVKSFLEFMLDKLHMYCDNIAQ